jgi:hypothetical protein
MGDSYEDTTGEGHGQEKADHSRSLVEATKDRQSRPICPY